MFSAWRYRVAVAVTGSLLLLPRGAHAEPSPSQIAAARELFNEATELREAGKWAEAAAKLHEAVAIKETPGLWFHLAHCEQELGHLVEARADYDRADALVRDGMKAPDVVTLLEPARVALRERIPTLSLRVSPDAQGVRVLIDETGLPTTELGAPIPLNPGPHRVVVEASGRQPFSVDVTLAEGDDRVIEANLDLPPAVSPSVAPLPQRHADVVGDMRGGNGGIGLREGVLVGEGVVTLAGLAVGTIFTVRYVQSGNRATNDQHAIDSLAGAGSKSACSTASTASAPCHDLVQAFDERADDRKIAIYGFVGAGVGVASLLTTVLLWPTRKSSRHAHAEFLPMLGGAFVRGTF